MEKNIFKGRTKNDIKQCFFLAKLFNMPVEEIAKPVKFTDEHYPKKPDEYWEMIAQGMVNGDWDDEQDYILQQSNDYPKY
jgi:hypothetical protein